MGMIRPITSRAITQLSSASKPARPQAVKDGIFSCKVDEALNYQMRKYSPPTA